MVYRELAAIPADNAVSADEDGDGILTQLDHTVFARAGSAGFTRQFLGPRRRGLADVQLNCTLYWHPSRETDALASGHLRSSGMVPAAFFAEPVALPGWD